MMLGDFSGHHTLWGYEEVNNRGQLLENVIQKQLFNITRLNDKSRTYCHSANGTFTSIDLIFSSPALYLISPS